MKPAAKAERPTYGQLRALGEVARAATTLQIVKAQAAAAGCAPELIAHAERDAVIAELSAVTA